jgi:hypothetical protein
MPIQAGATDAGGTHETCPHCEQISQLFINGVTVACKHLHSGLGGGRTMAVLGGAR